MKISFDWLHANSLYEFLCKVGQDQDLVCYRKSSHSGSVPDDSGS